jgi:hypothetical protein
MPDTPIPFEGVERLTDTGLGGNYRIVGKVVFVGSAVPLEGSNVYHVGDVGRLVLPRWFVEQNHIPSEGSC